MLTSKKCRWKLSKKLVHRGQILGRNCNRYSGGLYSPPPPPPWAKVFWNWVVCKHCIWKPQVWELSRLCPETSTKSYVHEFDFSCTVSSVTINPRRWLFYFKKILLGSMTSLHIGCYARVKKNSKIYNFSMWLGHRERFLSWLSSSFIALTCRWNVAASRISGMVWQCCQTIQRGGEDLFLPQRILPVHIT